MYDVVGITRSFNEDDIIESSMRRMAAQVDHVIIGDNSTDNTRAILDGLVAEGLAITVLDDDAPSVAQREVMTRYAHEAREMGASWAVFFDIDEVWAADGGRMANQLMDLPELALIVHARNITHCATSEDDGSNLDPCTRMGWRSVEMLPLGKVACRLRDDLVIGHGNHNATFTNERRPLTVTNLIESRHFPYRSPEQLIKRVKGAWPQLRDSGLPESHGAHMWAYGRHLDEFGEDGLRAWFADGMFFTDPASNPDLIFDPLPPMPAPCRLPS